MPALAPVPPEVFKRIFEKAGYVLEAENEHTWMLISGDHPAVIPKYGRLVAIDIMESNLGPSGINDRDYFAHLEEVKIDMGITEEDWDEMIGLAAAEDEPDAGE